MIKFHKIFANLGKSIKAACLAGVGVVQAHPVAAAVVVVVVVGGLTYVYYKNKKHKEKEKEDDLKYSSGQFKGEQENTDIFFYDPLTKTISDAPPSSTSNNIIRRKIAKKASSATENSHCEIRDDKKNSASSKEILTKTSANILIINNMSSEENLDSDINWENVQMEASGNESNINYEHFFQKNSLDSDVLGKDVRTETSSKEPNIQDGNVLYRNDFDNGMNGERLQIETSESDSNINSGHVFTGNNLNIEMSGEVIIESTRSSSYFTENLHANASNLPTESDIRINDRDINDGSVLPGCSVMNKNEKLTQCTFMDISQTDSTENTSHSTEKLNESSHSFSDSSSIPSRMSDDFIWDDIFAVSYDHIGGGTTGDDCECPQEILRILKRCRLCRSKITN